MRRLAPLALLIAIVPARAQSRPDALIEAWYESNDACQSTSIRDRDLACDKRSTLRSAIEGAGWCKAKGGDVLDGAKWQPCGR